MPDFVAELWLEMRPRMVAQADGIVASARVWAGTGDTTAWQEVVGNAHQLAGSLGSYGQAGPAAAARALDDLTHESSADPAVITAAAERLQSSLTGPGGPAAP